MTDQPSTTNVVNEASAHSPASAAVAAKPRGKVNNPYSWGTGRRKTSVARVRVRPGSGKFLVNDREVPSYFTTDRDRAVVSQPLRVTDTAKSYDVFVRVHGGGITGQAGAIVLGLARALSEANPDYEAKLREHKLLTRDPREVERKKYGRSGARRRFQFSKR